MGISIVKDPKMTHIDASKSGAVGIITDHLNGTYTATFRLLWEGENTSAVCNYSDPHAGGWWYCEKPANISCNTPALDENRRIRVVYSRTHARKFQIYGHFQVCATRTLGVCGPAHGPDMNHSGVRAVYRPAHACTRHPLVPRILATGFPKNEAYSDVHKLPNQPQLGE
ncbi:Neurexophilin [Branchiostoma belcheri]|nr:Neurexophilin [Branchiostoma belcheri]